MAFENILTLLISFVIVISVVIRGRKKVRCMELQLSMNKPIAEIREDAEKRYNENRLVQVVDLCRELESRVQNRCLLLEILIDDADVRIAQLLNGGRTAANASELAQPNESGHWSLGSDQFKKAFLKKVEEGKSDTELALEFKRTPLVMTLLRDLWRMPR